MCERKTEREERDSMYGKVPSSVSCFYSVGCLCAEMSEANRDQNVPDMQYIDLKVLTYSRNILLIPYA